MNEPNTPAPPSAPPAPAATAAAATTMPPPPVAYAPSAYVRPIKSPAVAGVLSMLPGVGHIYLGLYARAAVFFAVWILAMSIASHGHGPIGVIVPFWWFFVVIDAVRQAQAINATGQAPAANPDELKLPRAGGSLGMGVFLILLGIWFLLDRFVTIDLSFLLDWWPLLLVLFGGWQVFSYFKAKEKAEAPKDETPAV